MKIFHVPTPEGFESEKGIVDNLTTALIAKEAYIALGAVGNQILSHPFFDTTNNYSIMNFRWCIQCSVKLSRLSSIFRILSVELWIFLIISIVFAVIATTLVARFSCTSEWQGYKTQVR
jgi:hypothetical protein